MSSKKNVQIGGVTIGGGAPVAIQDLTPASVSQTYQFCPLATVERGQPA